MFEKTGEIGLVPGVGIAIVKCFRRTMLVVVDESLGLSLCFRRHASPRCERRVFCGRIREDGIGSQIADIAESLVTHAAAKGPLFESHCHSFSTRLCALAFTLPGGRVKSLWGIQVFSCVLMRLMPDLVDPVALRGLNAYSRFSSHARARAIDSASTATSFPLPPGPVEPASSPLPSVSPCLRVQVYSGGQEDGEIAG